MSELEIFAWGNTDKNFARLGRWCGVASRVCKRRFTFDGRPQKIVTNGTNIMYLWRNSVSESDVMRVVAQSKSDVVDLNVFEDESKEEEKEEKFDFESTHEKIRRRAEHTSWLVLRLWSQIMGLSPRDDQRSNVSLLSGVSKRFIVSSPRVMRVSILRC